MSTPGNGEDGGSKTPPVRSADDKIEAKAPPILIELPPVIPPETKTPFEFKQQINLSALPPSVLDKFSPQELCELTKAVLTNTDRADERRFQFFMDKSKREAEHNKRCLFVGALVTAAAYGVSAYLGATGHETIALCIALPLTTVLAIIVGKKL